jgi:hypothetical protein
MGEGDEEGSGEGEGAYLLMDGRAVSHAALETTGLVPETDPRSTGTMPMHRSCILAHHNTRSVGSQGAGYLRPAMIAPLGGECLCPLCLPPYCNPVPTPTPSSDWRCGTGRRRSVWSPPRTRSVLFHLSAPPGRRRQAGTAALALCRLLCHAAGGERGLGRGPHKIHHRPSTWARAASAWGSQNVICIVR